MAPQHDPPNSHQILVAVITTGGTFPTKGWDEVPDHQPVKVELAHAGSKLGITNTTGWIATAGGKDLSIEQSYIENHLAGEIEIHWGPREGGGGAS